MTEHFDEIRCNRLVISNRNGKGFISLDFDDGTPSISLHNENEGSITNIGDIALGFNDDGTPSLILHNRKAGGTGTGSVNVTFGDDGNPVLSIASADHRGGVIHVIAGHNGSRITLSTNDRFANSNVGIIITTTDNDSMVIIEDEALIEDRSTRQIEK